MKNDNIEFSLNSIGFIIQHPWLFISPIIIVMSFTLSYVSILPSAYECSAIVLYETSAETTINDKYVETQKELFGSILAGENLRHIVSEVWPKVDAKSESAKFNELMDRLRLDIKLQQDEDRGPGYYSIYFRGTDPSICYRTVLTTVDTIKWTWKRKTEMESESGVAFLKQQSQFYKDKMSALSKELVRLKSELLESYPEMSDQDKSMIDDIVNIGRISDRSMQTQIKVQKAASIDDKLTNYNLQLVDLNKKKESLKERMEKGDYQVSSLTAEQMGQDNFIRSYELGISTKTQQLADMLSKGLTSEHPHIIALREEIARLEVFKEKRAEELMDFSKVPRNIKRLIEKNYEKQMASLDMKLESVRSKISSLEQYKAQYENKLSVEERSTNPIFYKVGKYSELKSEQELTTKYYNDIRQQLELAEIKNRVEKADAGARIVVIEEPRLPTAPVPMQKTKPIIFGFMLGTFMGIGLSYLVNAFDKSIKSSSELRELLQIPVLASIDRICTSKDIQTKQYQRSVLFVVLVLTMALSPILMKIFAKFIIR